jgi:hypothetical protein
MTALKDHLAKAHNHIKTQAGCSRVDGQFQVGDQVLLKLEPYAQQYVVITCPFPKLVFKFFGPYDVVKIGKAAYHLNLPEGSLVHPVFHLSA